MSNVTYWGVKVFDGTGVVYDLVYNYDGHPGIVNESLLGLGKRDHNADFTWSLEAAALNTLANTLTLLGETTGTEYILTESTLTPLPITLVAFEASITEQREVQLNWTTASEQNNDFFTVERSTNGIDWEAVVYVDGAGNSSNVIDYEDVDRSPYQGVSYYRLKQTDFDGATTYSDAERVEINGEAGLVSVYPNPSNGVLQVATTTESENVIALYLFDTRGSVVLSQEWNVSSGFNKQELDATQLPSGVFVLKAISKDGSLLHQQKVTVL